MGYVSANRGFQSGGWNLQTPQNPAFGPERLDDFEAGLKFADRSQRVSAQAGAFYYDYSDLQISAITPIGAATTNAAWAEVYGLELQLSAQLGRRTDVTLGLQSLKTRYGRFPNASCTDYSNDVGSPLLPIQCDATGNQFPFAPKLKFNVGATHEVPLGQAGALSVSGNLAYNSGYFSEPDNVVRQGSFATLDASVEWRTNWRGPSVRLWVLNLTNAHYYDSLATMPTVGVFQRPAAPRRVGVSVAYAF